MSRKKKKDVVGKYKKAVLNSKLYGEFESERSFLADKTSNNLSKPKSKDDKADGHHYIAHPLACWAQGRPS